MTKKTRRTFTPEQKVAILRQHLIDHKPVSEVCELHNLQPNLFYSWQRQFFENGALAFEKTSKASQKPLQNKVQKLEEKIAQKDEVIAEIAQMCVQLKKELGDP